MMVVAREGSSSVEGLERQAPPTPDHSDPQSHLNMGGVSPAEGPTPPAPPQQQQQQQSDGYWNMHLEVLSKLKGEVKDWYEGGDSMEGTAGGLGQGGGRVKQEPDPYAAYPPHLPPHHHPMTPEPHTMNGPLGGHMGYPMQQQQQTTQAHYQGYHNQGMGGDMAPMSPGYQRPHPQQHMAQQHMGAHIGGYTDQGYGYQMGGHMGAAGMGGHPGHEGGPPGREGDPYSFVDEYTGPPPRPIEEVLGQTQPKRRGRKPKHIKLMENGLPHDTDRGDPLAIAAAQAAHEAKKRKWKQLGPDGKPILAPIKQRKKVDRFDGISEDEVAKRTLPDHLGPNLDIVIISKFPFQIGINPGLFAAYKGHHYAGPGNHFWKCLYLSGLIPEPLTSEDDFRLLEHGIGFTNIVARTTRGSADLTRKEIKEGGQILLSKLQRFQPRIAVFNGKGIYEIFSGKKEFTFGRQPEKIEGTHTHVWVMPSSSARCAQLPRALDKVPFYTALRKFRDFLKGTLEELHEEEITCINAKVKNLKMEPAEKMELGGGCVDEMPVAGGELCRPPMSVQPPPDPMSPPMHDEDRLVIKEEVDVGTKLEGDGEEDEITKELPRTLFNLNGMTRDQLNCMDCPTIPIRKKRGRPKKTPEDPNAPPRPRPRPVSTDPLMFNGEQPIKKKRGRPKKVLEDGTIPPPKRPGRKPKALKEMLAQQQQQQVQQPQHLHHPQMGQHPQLGQQLGQQQSVGLTHINGIMSPTGYSPNPGPQTFSPQYPGHTPVHGGSHTPVHGGTGSHTPVLGGGGSHTPVHGGGGSHTPVHGGGGSHTPVHGGGGSHTPVHGGSHTPVHGGGSHTPVHGTGNHTPVHGGGSLTPVHGAGSHTPVHGGGSLTPVHGAGSHTPVHGGSLTPVHGGGSLTPVHGGSLTPNHTGSQPPTHNPAMVPRGPTPHQFGQSPGYSPGPAVNPQQAGRIYQGGPPQDTPGEMKVDEEHQLGLASPPASPLMAQPDFEPPSSMPDGDMNLPPSLAPAHTPGDAHTPAALTPGHPDEGKTPGPPQPQFSNPTTPVDGSSYQNYPSYPSTASHSPSMSKPAPIHPGQSPTMTGKGDVASKSLSGLESLVDQIPSLSEQDGTSQHSQHSNSAPCSTPTTPGPAPPFSPGHAPPTSSYSYPGGGGGGAGSGGAAGYPYGSPQQQQQPYSPHYPSTSTNLSTNFSVSSLASSSIATTNAYSSTYDLSSPSTSSFSVSSLASSSNPAPSPSMYSQSYSPAPSSSAPGPPSYPEIVSPSMLAPTPSMGSSFMGSPGLMTSTSPMSSSMGGSSMGMGALHSSMGSQLPYPYSQYSDPSPSYPHPPGHSSFPYPPTAPGFHVPSPRFPYPSPYANSPYTQGYSQNAMLERIKQTSMGMGFGGF